MPWGWNGAIVRSIRSASNRTVARAPSCWTWCGVRGVTSTVTRAWLPLHVVPHDDARGPNGALQDEPRRFAELERNVRDERERAADELDRHVPARANLDRRRRQRHQAAADRGERLVLRQDDRLALVGDRDRAGDGVFAHGQAEQRREVVERDELGVAAHHGRDVPRAVGRDKPERRRRSRLAGHRDRGARRKRCQQRRPRDRAALRSS